MELIAILFFVGIYLLISIGIVKAAIVWARRQQRRTWLWGGIAGFVMYNLVFWDWIPTMIAYKYYCDTQAGFIVFKTPEQWKSENPSLNKSDLQSLGKGHNLADFPYRSLPGDIIKKEIMLNSYLYLGRKNDYFIDSLPIHREIKFIADNRTNEIMAKLVTFSTGYLDRNSWKAMKYWMHFSLCGYEYGGALEKNTGYISFIDKIIELGEKND